MQKMNLERMNMHTKFYKIVLTLFAAVTLVACVDNDDDIPMNYYSASKVTAAGFLEKNQDQFSEFISILKRTPYFSMLSTYGDYTLFAPDNSAIERYLKRMGYNSIDAITDESCDTLARTHIIKKGAFFTTDISEGALPELNMADAYIVLSSDSDVQNHNALVYYINKNARVIERDDSVTNGVVHVLNNVITSSSLLLADKIGEDSTLTLFYQALKLTGMADSLVRYLDETYTCGEDSVHEGVMVRCTSGSALYTRSFWPGKRYFKYTAFVEPDSVYHSKGINNIEDLKAYAEERDLSFPMGLVGDTGLESYASQGTPTSVLVGADGKILASEVGALGSVDDFLALFEGHSGENYNPEECTYIIYAEDEEQNPIADVTFGFCTDTACRYVTTDEDGKAVFKGEPTKYHIQIIDVPDGYTDELEETYTEPYDQTLYLMVTKG